MEKSKLGHDCERPHDEIYPTIPFKKKKEQRFTQQQCPMNFGTSEMGHHLIGRARILNAYKHVDAQCSYTFKAFLLGRSWCYFCKFAITSNMGHAWMISVDTFDLFISNQIKESLKVAWMNGWMACLGNCSIHLRENVLIWAYCI